MTTDPHSVTEAPQTSAPPRKKKIVICCDGTGNEFSAPNPDPKNKAAGQNSNVVKLYTALEVNKDQVAYYHPGVGTMGAPNAAYWWSKWWSKTKGLAFGAGFRENVLDAYRYLMEEYADNGGNGNQDEVYIFGFSRGAYTARALAGLLHGYGLLCKGNEGHLPYAWRMYVEQHDDRNQASIQPDHAFRETFSHQDFRIQFMGVWDTVSSVGWITQPMRLLNLAENDTIRRVRHAISIDEHRCFFQDNLFADPVTRKVRALNAAIAPRAADAPPANKDIVQVWFAGVHSDIGGSYVQTESGLSRITLEWMLGEVGVMPNGMDEDGKNTYPDAPGIRLNPERMKLVFGEPAPDPKHVLWYESPSAPKEREAPPWMKMHKSLCRGWWVLEFIPHIYFNMDDGQEERRVPLGLRLRQIPPGSLVHPSVVARMEDKRFNYAPRNVHRDELALFSEGPKTAAGLAYYRFTPNDSRHHGKLFNLFDRYVLTWFFTILDVVIVLPLLLWLAVAVAATAVAVAAALLLGLWHVALHLVPGFVHIVLHWFELLWGWLKMYGDWLRRL